MQLHKCQILRSSLNCITTFPYLLLFFFFLKEEFERRIFFFKKNQYLYLLYRVLAIDFKIIYKLDPCAIEVLSMILLLLSVATCHFFSVITLPDWFTIFSTVFHWSSKLDTPLFFFSYNIAKLRMPRHYISKMFRN